MSEFPDATRACARPGLAGEIQHPLETIATELRNLRVVLERIERRMMTPAERAEADRAQTRSASGSSAEAVRSAPVVPRGQANARETLPSSSAGTMLLDIPAASAELRLHRVTVYKLIAAGHLEAVKCGRRTLIRREALDRYVAGLPFVSRA